VSGTVVDIRYGSPVAGAKVLVLGQTAPVTTDSAGHFTVPGVTPPYGIAAVDIGADGTNPGVHAWLGLMRRDPTLGIDGKVKWVPTSTATLTFSVTNPSGVAINQFMTHDEVYFDDQKGLLQWQGSGPVTGVFASYGLGGIGTQCADLSGYGTTASLTVAPGASLGAVTVTQQPVKGTPLQGSLTLPDQLSLDVLSYDVHTAEGGVVSVGVTCISDLSNLSFPVLDVPGGSISLMVIANDAKVGGVRRAQVPVASIKLGTPFHVDVPAPPFATAPDYPVVWPPKLSAVSRLTSPHVAVFQIAPHFGWSGPAIDVVTDSDTLVVPDLSALGAVVAPSTSMDWSVSDVPEFASVDDVAAGPLLNVLTLGLKYSDLRGNGKGFETQ
jgi:hypothetical protein